MSGNPSIHQLPNDTIGEQDFYSGDHLMVFLRKKLKLNKSEILIGIIMLAGIVFFGGSGIAGGKFTKDYGLIHNMINSLRKTLGLIPLGFAIYLYLPSAIALLINTLRNNQVIVEKNESAVSYNELTKTLKKRVNAAVLEVGSLIVVVAYWLVRLYNYCPNKRPLWLEIAALFVYSLVLYGALIGVTRLFMMVRYSNSLFGQFTIRVSPLHPDDAAGLSVFGRMFTMSITIAAAIAIIIAIGMISPHPIPYSALLRPEPWFVAGIYISLIPVLFFSWLWLPHKAMIEARNRKLQPLADRFLESVEATQLSGEDSAERIKARTEELTELKRQYELLKDTYPVWPIRIQKIRKVIAISSTPLISIASTPLVSKFIWGH